MMVKLKSTIRNLMGEVMRKGSIVYAEKMHRGFELTKRKRKKNKNGFLCVVSITRVKADSFKILSEKTNK
jgi:hypothetical protein